MWCIGEESSVIRGNGCSVCENVVSHYEKVTDEWNRDDGGAEI